MTVHKAEPKWRRRSDERPDEILDAALDEFVERGFSEARVEDIARRAGISKAGVYLYFASKEEILRALIEREIAPVARRARMLAEAGTADPLGTLRGLIGGIVNVLDNPRIAAVPRIVFSVAGQFPGIARYYRENVVAEGLAAFKAVHSAGVAQGIFRDLDFIVAARAVVGPIFVQVVLMHILGLPPDGMSVEERANAHIDLLLNGLLADKERGAA